MAKDYHTTDLSRFDAAFIDYATAEAAAKAVEDNPACPPSDRVLKVLADAVDTIFAIAAPTLGGVARKLEVYWGELLFQDDWYGVDWHQTAIGDIRRIEMQLAGVEEPDASGGLDMKKVARDWTVSLRQLDRWALLLAEGSSDNCGNSKQSDIVALLDEAEAAMLSLPAPHLLAVIKKLEILSSERFDRADDKAEHLLIMSDLRRFAPKHQQRQSASDLGHVAPN